MAREDFGPTPQASKEVDRGSHLKHLPFMKKDSRLAPQASKKGSRVPEQRRAPGAGVEDFIPWVAPISIRPPAREEEEEDDEMADLAQTSVHGSANGVPASSGRLMLPSRWLVSLINT